MRIARVSVRILRLIRTSGVCSTMTIIPYAGDAGNKSQHAHSSSVRTSDAHSGMTIMPYADSKSQYAYFPSDQDLRCPLGNDHYVIIMRAARIIVRILRLIRTSDARLGMTIMPYAGSKSQRAHSPSDQDLRCQLTEPEDTISALGLLCSHLALGFSSEVAYHF